MRHRGDDQLPAGENQRMHRHRPPLEDEGARGPANARQQPEREAERRLGVGVEAVGDQQRHAQPADGQCQHEAAVRTVAEEEPCDERRPQWHREAEDGRLARRDEDRSIGAGDVPDHEVRERGSQHGAPVRRVESRATRRAGARSASRTRPAPSRLDAPERPHRDLAHGDREQRPVGAPHQGEDDQEGNGPGFGGCGRALEFLHAVEEVAARTCDRGGGAEREINLTAVFGMPSVCAVRWFTRASSPRPCRPRYQVPAKTSQRMIFVGGPSGPIASRGCCRVSSGLAAGIGPEGPPTGRTAGRRAWGRA